MHFFGKVSGHLFGICTKTARAAGLPDPPVDVQVENGPQDGTMLVTWMPVAGSGAPVTGYAVYADGKKVTDIDSPTGLLLRDECF